LRTLSEHREKAFDLLRLALTAPRFDDAAIERTRSQMLAQLRRESTDPGSLAAKAWWSKAFPNHPYGRPSNGSNESVAALNQADLKTYARRVMARDKLKIAIVGDIDAASARTMLDKVFGALPARAELLPVVTVAPADLGQKSTVSFDTPQSIVSFGGVGLPRKHPDYMTAHVVNHILGGGSFTSRLYQEIREKRGLAYGVSTYLYPMQYSALFMGWTQVRAEKADESVTVMQHEIRQMAERGPTEEELAKAKDYLKGSYALGFDTSSKIAAQLVSIQTQELGIDYIAARDKLIDAITVADAQRVAKSLLEGGLLFTVVGKPTSASTRSTNPG
jgi:zinc protease